MGRSQQRTERLQPIVIQGINRLCFGGRSAYWRRYIDDTRCTLPQFSAAMRGELTDPAVVTEILSTLHVAALEQPLKELLQWECPTCGEELSDNPPVVVEYDPGVSSPVRYRQNEYDFSGERVVKKDLAAA